MISEQEIIKKKLMVSIFDEENIVITFSDDWCRLVPRKLFTNDTNFNVLNNLLCQRLIFSLELNIPTISWHAKGDSFKIQYLKTFEYIKKNF